MQITKTPFQHMRELEQKVWADIENASWVLDPIPEKKDSLDKRQWHNTIAGQEA